MRVWRGLAASGAWLLAVAVVAGVAWFATDSAGHEVGADGVVGLVVAPGPAPGGAPATTSSPSAIAGSSPSATAGSSPVPTQATTARDVRKSPAPSRPAASRSTIPSGGTTATTTTSTTTTTTTTATTSAPPRPTRPESGCSSGGSSGGPGTGAFSSAGGALVVRCAGAEVDGWAVRPADGWRADPKLVARQELLVVFTSGDGSVIEVRAICREGGASFSAQSRSPRP